jgi:hypothetical protein
MVAVRPPLEGWAGIGEDVPEGRRNDAIARLAGKLLRHGLGLEMAGALMHAFNEARCKPPLEPDEVRRTVESVARKEAARRAGGGAPSVAGAISHTP